MDISLKYKVPCSHRFGETIFCCPWHNFIARGISENVSIVRTAANHSLWPDTPVSWRLSPTFTDYSKPIADSSCVPTLSHSSGRMRGIQKQCKTDLGRVQTDLLCPTDRIVLLLTDHRNIEDDKEVPVEVMAYLQIVSQ